MNYKIQKQFFNYFFSNLNILIFIVYNSLYLLVLYFAVLNKENHEKIFCSLKKYNREIKM